MGQPRPQGFSLKTCFEGKALGTRLRGHALGKTQHRSRGRGHPFHILFMLCDSNKKLKIRWDDSHEEQKK